MGSCSVWSASVVVAALRSSEWGMFVWSDDTSMLTSQSVGTFVFRIRFANVVET